MESDKQPQQQTKLQDYKWNQPISPSTAIKFQNLSRIGISKVKPNQGPLFLKEVRSVIISKQVFLLRKQQLESFKHQNYVPVQITEIKYQQISKQPFVKQLYVISPYIQQSITLQKLLSNNLQICRKNVLTIFYQIVNVMLFAEAQSICHFRLNPSAILLIKSKNQKNSEFFVQVCDWGLGNQGFYPCDVNKQPSYTSYIQKLSKTSFFEFQHPQILLQVNNKQIYQSNKSKYDIWSIGVIMHILVYKKHPFYGQNGFSLQKLKKFYEKQKHIKIQEESLLATLIRKMLNLEGFKNWSQIKHFLISKAQLLQIDFLPVQQILQKHYNFLNYSIGVFKLIAWNISNSANSFWYENKSILKNGLMHILKLMFFLHKIKFIQRFGHRLYGLSEQQKIQFNHLTNLIQTQWDRIISMDSALDKFSDFFKHLEDLKQCLLSVQLQINDYESGSFKKEVSTLGFHLKQTWPSMQLLKSFNSAILEAINDIQSRNKYILHYFYNISCKSL